jgi:hypothetical protein
MKIQKRGCSGKDPGTTRTTVANADNESLARAGLSFGSPCKEALTEGTERRRSRTYRAVGYTTAPVLKVCVPRSCPYQMLLAQPSPVTFGHVRSRQVGTKTRYQVGRDDDRLTSAARAGASRGSRSLPSMGGRVLDLFAGAGGLAEGLAGSSSRRSTTEQRGQRQVSRRRPLRSDPRAVLIRSTPRD